MVSRPTAFPPVGRTRLSEPLSAPGRTDLDTELDRTRCGTEPISAVQQTTGAEALMEVSPVTMPTLSAPNRRTSSKNFSLTRALSGAV